MGCSIFKHEPAKKTAEVFGYDVSSTVAPPFEKEPLINKPPNPRIPSPGDGSGAPQMIQVQIPQGLSGGQTFQVQAPSGGMMTAQVPLGMCGGQSMQIPAGLAALQVLPALELSVTWNQQPHRMPAMSEPWTQKDADWLNRRLLSHLPELVSGREEVVFAGVLASRKSACILLSTGRLLELSREPSNCCAAKVPPLVGTCHLYDIRGICVAKNMIVAGVKGDALCCFDISLAKRFPSAPPEAPCDTGPRIRDGSMSLLMTKDQAKALLTSLRKLVHGLKSVPFDIKLDIDEPESYKEKLQLPSPLCDDGFCMVFYAMCSYFGVEFTDIKLGASFFDALPFLELDITGMRPLDTGNKIMMAQVAFAAKEGMLRSKRFCSFRCGQQISDSAFKELLPILKAGTLLKLDLSGAKLSGAALLELGRTMSAKGTNTIVDINLDSARFNPEAADALSKAFESTVGSLRNVSLANCGLTAEMVSKMFNGMRLKLKVLEHLNLSQNSIGRLPDPHPLKQVFASPKLQTFNISGTKMEVARIVEDANEKNLRGLRKFLVSDTVFPPVKLEGTSLVAFLSCLGVNFEEISVGNCLGSPQLVESLLSCLGNKPSPRLKVDLCGLASSFDGVTLAMQKGVLPWHVVIDTTLSSADVMSHFNAMELFASTQFVKSSGPSQGGGQQMIQVQIPQGVAAGQTFQVQTPSGMLPVQVQAGMVAGQTIQFPAGQASTARPGSEIQSEVAEAILIKLKDMHPFFAKMSSFGDASAAGGINGLSMRAGAAGEPQMIQVPIPPGVAAGQQFQVQTPSGKMTVQAPAGMSAGQMMTFPEPGQGPSVQVVLKAGNDLSHPRALLSVSGGVGAGPGTALVLPGLAKSKNLKELDLANNVGGDALAFVLGIKFLRVNRSVRSLRVDGNYFSHMGLAAIRGAFYGNRKLLDFPLPDQDIEARLKLYRDTIPVLENQCLQFRANIKRAFKSTKGARTPYVLQTLNTEVAKISANKGKIARFRSSMNSYGKILSEIQQAIHRNQQDAKNINDMAKESSKLLRYDWAAANKALESAKKLEQEREVKLAEMKNTLPGERRAILELWHTAYQKMKKSKKNVRWFEAWRTDATTSQGSAPLLSHETAEVLLASIPEDQAGSLKTEVKRTETFIRNEMELLAQLELTAGQINTNNMVANNIMQQPGYQPPPPGKFAAVAEASRAPVVQTGTVVQPPPILVKATIVSAPINEASVVQGVVVTPTAANAKYEQFSTYQAQQKQQQTQFNQKRGIGKGAMIGGGVAAGAGLGFAGAYLYSSQSWKWHNSHYYGHNSYHHHDDHHNYDSHDNDSYEHDYGVDWAEGTVDPGQSVDPSGDAMSQINESQGDSQPFDSAADAAEAADVVDMYAGGEDDRPGAGPPPYSPLACPAWCHPSAPRLDVYEWFQERMHAAEKEALEEVLGRAGPLPCAEEVLLRTSLPQVASAAWAVCLVTQCSLDRLDRLQAQLEAWDGEVSAAVYVDASADSLAAAKARRDVVQACAVAAARRMEQHKVDGIGGEPLLAWTISMVFKLEESEMRCPSYDALYPVNTLRNRALNHARAQLVFLLDVDFLPSRGLHARLCGGDMGCSLHKALLGEVGGSPVALVVPAFEVDGVVPRDEAMLRLEYEAGKAKGFHVRQFPRGHKATCFDRWFAGVTASSDFQGLSEATQGLNAYSVEYEDHFEPYVVMARSIVPAYDERFRGYGLNKISHLYDAHMAGFTFTVIDHADAFVVASEHPRSQSWKLMYGPAADAEHRARLATHFAEFKKSCAARESKAFKVPMTVAPLKISQCVELPPQVVALAERLAAQGKLFAYEVAQAA